MSAKSPNFSFLEDLDQLLFQYALSAEKYCLEDPNDQPASELLAQIKKSKENKLK